MFNVVFLSKRVNTISGENMKKLITIITAIFIFFTFHAQTSTAAKATPKKAVVISKTANVRSGPGTNYKVVGTLKKGASLLVVSTTKNNWSKISYNKKDAYISNTVLSFKTTTTTTNANNFKAYNGKWFTSATSSPGIGVDIKFLSNNKANIDLYGIWWSQPDGSNARVSEASGYTITFDKNGIGKFKFEESFNLNVGVATVKLISGNVYVTVEYSKSDPANSFLDNYIYEGTFKLVRRKF
jgi:uncharacterized protein YgiM (DUF1202 family)